MARWIIAIVAMVLLIAASYVAMTVEVGRTDVAALPWVTTTWLTIIGATPILAWLPLGSRLSAWADRRAARIVLWVALSVLYVGYATLVMGYLAFYAHMSVPVDPAAGPFTISDDAVGPVLAVLFIAGATAGAGLIGLPFFRPVRNTVATRPNVRDAGGATSTAPQGAWPAVRGWFSTISISSFALAAMLAVSAIPLFVVFLVTSLPQISDPDALYPPDYIEPAAQTIMIAGYVGIPLLAIVGLVTLILAPRGRNSVA